MNFIVDSLNSSFSTIMKAYYPNGSPRLPTVEDKKAMRKQLNQLEVKSYGILVIGAVGVPVGLWAYRLPYLGKILSLATFIFSGTMLLTGLNLKTISSNLKVYLNKSWIDSGKSLVEQLVLQETEKNFRIAITKQACKGIYLEEIIISYIDQQIRENSKRK